MPAVAYAHIRQDFKEKGAVGAVKDAVADAGDILIDGVSGQDKPVSSWEATHQAQNHKSKPPTRVRLMFDNRFPLSMFVGSTRLYAGGLFKS